MSKNNQRIEIKQIISQGNLQVTHIYNKKWISNQVKHPRTQKPGLALAGYFKYLGIDRIQIFGKTEIGYLSQLNQEERKKRLKNFFSLKIAGVFVSENQDIKELIIPNILKYKTPILISKLRTSLLVSRISALLYHHFSKKIRVNGVLMDIMGIGTLIIGDSGIGKSETALELVNQGNQLISDDLIEFYLNSNDEPVGRSIDRIKKWIEVRGLGIINIVDIYGVGALMNEKKLDLVIDLEKWSPNKKYDRLGEETQYNKILGKDIPMFTLPVAPGRNLATLIEVAVKFFISRKNGSQSFIEHIHKRNNKE
ncbi:MAG: HPr(Ser) kinase/phosphatase [Candidatus Aminicenantes bacterium]|nr:HPr(Ser) kinase/phosphatase [Candidatus Aminicenantes bacterium]